MAALGFLARYRVEHTRYAYGIALKQWFGWCREHDLDPMAAKRAHVEVFARELEATGRKATTVGTKLHALAGFYKFALSDELIDRDPMVHVARPPVPNESTTNGVTWTEMADMLRVAEPDPRDHALVCILGLNGLRVSEATGIDLADLGRYRGQSIVTILRKGGAHQDIPFSYRTAWAVESLTAGRESGPLFLSREGNRLDRKGAGRIVKRVAAGAGITKRITCHSLRHGFVTLARDAGASDRDVIASCGWRDGRMIERYDRSRTAIERNATHTLTAFIERAA
jgi:site-specific recombinase XerD